MHKDLATSFGSQSEHEERVSIVRKVSPAPSGLCNDQTGRLQAQEVGSTSTRVRHEQDVKNSQRHQPGVFAKGRCPSMPEKKAFPSTWYPPTSMMGLLSTLYF